MTTQALALSVHLLGVVLWIGGAVSIATSMTKTGDDGPSEDVLAAARRAMAYQVNPGMLIAWGGGLTLLIPSFTTQYASAGWMHGKLTILLVLSALTGVLGARIRRAAKGQKPITSKFLGGVGAVFAIFAAVVIVLAVVQPG